MKSIFVGTVALLMLVGVSQGRADQGTLSGLWVGMASNSPSPKNPTGAPDAFTVTVDNADTAHVVRKAPDGDVGQPYDTKIEPWGPRKYGFHNATGTAAYVFTVSPDGHTVQGTWTFEGRGNPLRFHVNSTEFVIAGGEE